MKTYLDCIPCFFRQALEAARLATDDEVKQREVLNRVALEIPKFPLDATPVEMGRTIHRLIKEITGNQDPYAELKRHYNELAAKMVEKLKPLVRNADDPLQMAVRIAIAGNIIDFGALSNFDLDRSVEESLRFDFGVFDYEEFKRQLNASESVLYIGDNAGEICFDKLLIELMHEMGKKLIFAVRSVPIINDATVEDAVWCGIDRFAQVIDSGSDAPGTILEHCNPRFLEIFRRADMVIAKGQGNFETLSDAGRPIFFMLKAKCPIVARELGVRTGDIVLKLGGDATS